MFKQVDTKDDIISSEMTKAELKMNIAKFKMNIKKTGEDIAAQEFEVRFLNFAIDVAKTNLEEFVTESERTSKDAQANIEKAGKAKQVNEDVIDELNKAATLFERDFVSIEKLLDKHKWCEDMLFMLSPLQWQEDHKGKRLKAQTAQSEQNSEPEEKTVNEDKEKSLKTSPDGELPVGCIQSSSNNDTLVTNSVDEEGVEIYFSDPSQVVVLLPELTDQILPLMYNSIETDKTIELTRCKMKKIEEDLIHQVNRMMDRIDKEKKRATIFRKNVILHDPLKTQNKDKMLASHGKKVTEVYSSCVERPLLHLSTLEKLCGIERCLFLLFQKSEKIPEEIHHKLWQYKENEKKNRLREEYLRLERERNIEKMKKCMNRAMGERKKHSGRKIMPRTMVVKKKVVIIKPETPEDPLADLFTEDAD